MKLNLIDRDLLHLVKVNSQFLNLDPLLSLNQDDLQKQKSKVNFHKVEHNMQYGNLIQPSSRSLSTAGSGVNTCVRVSNARERAGSVRGVSWAHRELLLAQGEFLGSEISKLSVLTKLSLLALHRNNCL